MRFRQLVLLILSRGGEIYGQNFLSSTSILWYSILDHCSEAIELRHLRTFEVAYVVGHYRNFTYSHRPLALDAPEGGVSFLFDFKPHLMAQVHDRVCKLPVFDELGKSLHGYRSLVLDHFPAALMPFLAALCLEAQ